MRARILWISLAAVVFAIFGIAVAMTYWFRSYLHGKDFLTLISQLTGDALQANVVYEPLKWNGSAAYSEQATLEGRAGSMLKHVEARQLRAEINWRAAFSGTWRIEEIHITQLDGELGSSEAVATAPQTSSPKPSAFLALLPRRFELQQVRIDRAHILFESTSASDVAVIIKPDGRGIVIHGSGGKLSLPSGPVLDILNFRGRQQGKNFFLTESEMRLGSSGKISASGELSAGGLLRISWDEVNTYEVLNANWRKHLRGTLSGSAEILFPNLVRGKFFLRDARVEEVPMLATVADFTGNPSFRRMPLQELSGNFTYEDGKIKLSNIIAESKGLLRMEGTGEITPEGHLSGQFQIGVTPQTLQWLPGSQERIFTIARNGYLWTSLAVGGTLSNPTEDLSPRLAAALGKKIIKQGSDLIDAPINGVQDLLQIFQPLTR